MLLPLATFLAYVSSDARHDREQRDRGRALLLKLNTKFCNALAISADWGVICQWSVRLFDAANHDIARSRVEIDAMIETIDAVFTAGVFFKRVLCGNVPASLGEPDESLPRFPTGASGAKEPAGFLTQRTVRNLRHQYVFYSYGRPVLLWGERSAADKDDLWSRVNDVAALALEDAPRRRAPAQ